MKSPDGKLSVPKGSPAIDPIAEWVHGLDLSDIPSAAIDEAYRCLIDGIGVALAGSQNQVVSELVAPSATLYGHGNCTALTASEAALSAPAAALINGTAGHVLDFDDTSYTGIFHATAVCWPAVLAAAESNRVSGRRFLEAFIAGVETCYALADYLGHTIYFDGWWTTSVLGQIGAAAGVAKIIDLNLAQTKAAIGLAMATSAGSRAVLGSPAKPLGVGIAARQGLEAAYLARSGLHSGPDIAGSDHGWVSRLKPEAVAPSRLERLGVQFGLTDPGILFKQYPLCSAALAATQAAATIAQKRNLTPDRIASIDCTVTPLVATSLKFPAPATSEQAQFSLPFAVANAVAHGTVEPEHLALSHINGDNLRQVDGQGRNGRFGRSERHPSRSRRWTRRRNRLNHDHRLSNTHADPTRGLRYADQPNVDICPCREIQFLQPSMPDAAGFDQASGPNLQSRRPQRHDKTV